VATGATAVPEIHSGLLCNAAATDSTGLVSMLGAFVDAVQGPELPIRVQLWVVARLRWAQEDLGHAHTVQLRCEREDDGERLAVIDGTTMATPPPGADLARPMGTMIVLPLALEFRRTGSYRVVIVVDGDALWEAPIYVATTLPQV
jgi:hypothetical protein